MLVLHVAAQTVFREVFFNPKVSSGAVWRAKKGTRISVEKTHMYISDLTVKSFGCSK